MVQPGLTRTYPTSQCDSKLAAFLLPQLFKISNYGHVSSHLASRQITWPPHLLHALGHMLFKCISHTGLRRQFPWRSKWLITAYPRSRTVSYSTFIFFSFFFFLLQIEIELHRLYFLKYTGRHLTSVCLSKWSVYSLTFFLFFNVQITYFLVKFLIRNCFLIMS